MPGPVVASRVGRRVEEIAPGGDALDDVEEVEDLEGFKGRAFDAGFVEERGGVEEAAEAEAAAAGEHGADLGRALLLLVDPGEVGAGFEGEDPGAAERRGRCGRRCGRGGGATPERLGAGFGEGRRDGRQ